MAARTLPTQGGDAGTWGTELNTFIKGGLSYLGHATINTKHGDSKTTVYTVPTGKEAMIFAVLIHSPSATLVPTGGGASDYDIGSGTNADTWMQNVDLSMMTGTTDYRFLFSMGQYVTEAAAATFGIKPITGSAADTTATMVVFGMEVDA